MSLQQASAQDYIFATGVLHSVQDVVETAFRAVDLDWRQYLRRDERFMRPAEPLKLVGDATRAKTVLGWAPTIDFEALITRMTLAELVP